MNQINSPLYELFDYLRRSSIPIGTGDYLLAVNTICNGKGTKNLTQMRFTLKLIWAKSEEDLLLIDQVFERYFGPPINSNTQSASRPENLQAPQNSTVQETGQQSDRKNRDVQEQDTKNAEKNKKTEEPHTGQSNPPPKPTSRPQQKALGLNPDNLSSPKGQKYFSNGSYVFTQRLPLNRREMSSIWKHLRVMTRSGPKTEFDIEGTIEDICRNGVFTEPVMQAARRNKNQLLILIDTEGSMKPFEPLTSALLESIQLGSVFKQTNVFFFHNCPNRSVATSLGLLYFRPLEDVLEHHDGGILIISDAGAARNTYRTERVKQTRNFMDELFERTHLISWLNPLPQTRWQSNSAEHIAEYVPMFPIDRNGLIDTVNILQGRSGTRRAKSRVHN